MKELMIHVERIVRPVRAMQFRKLRMRRELLAHLQSAFEEERALGPDEPAARERAKRRLGEPSELTRGFQQSVPWIERTLMGRVPVGPAVERWELRSARAMGLEPNMTMLHTALVVLGSIALGYLAVLLVVMILDPKSYLVSIVERPGMYAVISAVATVVFLWHMMMCLQFTRAFALQSRTWAELLMSGVGIATLMLILLFLFVGQLAGRVVTIEHVARTALTANVLLIALGAVGYFVRGLSGRYQQWLTLDIAE